MNSGSQWTTLSQPSDSSDGVEQSPAPDPLLPSTSRANKRKVSPLRTFSDARKPKSARVEAGNSTPTRRPTSSRSATDSSVTTPNAGASSSRPRPRPKLSLNASSSNKGASRSLPRKGRLLSSASPAAPAQTQFERAQSYISISDSDDEDVSSNTQPLAEKELSNTFRPPQSRVSPAKFKANHQRKNSTATSGRKSATSISSGTPSVRHKKSYDEVIDITDTDDEAECPVPLPTQNSKRMSLGKPVAIPQGREISWGSDDEILEIIPSPQQLRRPPSLDASTSMARGTVESRPQLTTRGSDLGKSANGDDPTSSISLSADDVHDSPLSTNNTLLEQSNQELLNGMGAALSPPPKPPLLKKAPPPAAIAKGKYKSHVPPEASLDHSSDAEKSTSVGEPSSAPDAPPSKRVHNITQEMDFLDIAEKDDSTENTPSPPARFITPFGDRPLFLSSDDEMDERSPSVESITDMMEHMSSPYSKEPVTSSARTQDNGLTSTQSSSPHPGSSASPTPVTSSSAAVTAEEELVSPQNINRRTASFLNKFSSQRSKSGLSTPSIKTSLLVSTAVSNTQGQSTSIAMPIAATHLVDTPSKTRVDAADVYVKENIPGAGATTVPAFGSSSVSTSLAPEKRSTNLPAKTRTPVHAPQAPLVNPPFVFKGKASVAGHSPAAGPSTPSGLSLRPPPAQTRFNLVSTPAIFKRRPIREAPSVGGPRNSAGSAPSLSNATTGKIPPSEARSEREALPVIGTLREYDEKRGVPWWNPYLDPKRPPIPLDGALCDSVNNMPPGWERDPNRRLIFKAMIRNGSKYEDDAPPIEIINEIDDEPCPPFEFMWTNRMLYGQGVPRMDRDLKGCNCVGGCDPKNPGCACAMRQTWWYEALNIQDSEGFAYDVGRQLLYHGFPVFECNAACSCDEYCQNKVVQNGRKVRLSLKKTKYKGWGVFAEEDIPYGTFIGIYSGELLTDEEAHVRGEVYDAFGRTYLFNIDCSHLSRGPRKPSELIKAMAGVSPPVAKPGWEIRYCVDAFHAGNNHSCEPNCDLDPIYTYDADIEKPLLCAFTNMDVSKGEELCFSYHGDDPAPKKKGRKTKEKGKGPASTSMAELARVRAQCRCNAPGCLGYIFKYDSSPDETESTEVGSYHTDDD